MSLKLLLKKYEKIKKKIHKFYYFDRFAYKYLQCHIKV